jgi:hypothetical protein
MGELVSFVCVRADHQWDGGGSGRVHPTAGVLGWCPDATCGPAEAHDWRPCELVSVAAAANLAAYYGTVESAVS